MNSSINKSSDTSGDINFTGSWLSVISISLSLTTVVINLSVLLILAVYKRSRPQGSVFIINLIASDLFFPTFDIISYTNSRRSTSNTDLSKSNCSVYVFVFLFATFASTGNIIMVTLDRYVAVTRPFKYKDILSTSRIALLIVSNWVIAGTLSSIGMTSRQTQIPGGECLIYQVLCKLVALFICFVLVLAFVVLLAAYCVIAKEVRSNLRRTRPVLQGRFENTNSAADTVRKFPSRENSSYARHMEQQQCNEREDNDKNVNETARKSRSICVGQDDRAINDTILLFQASSSKRNTVTKADMFDVLNQQSKEEVQCKMPNETIKSLTNQNNNSPNCKTSTVRGKDQVSRLQRNISTDKHLHRFKNPEDFKGLDDENACGNSTDSKIKQKRSFYAEKGSEKREPTRMDAALRWRRIIKSKNLVNSTRTRETLSTHSKQSNVIQRSGSLSEGKTKVETEHIEVQTAEKLVLNMERKNLNQDESPMCIVTGASWMVEQNPSCDKELVPRPQFQGPSNLPMLKGTKDILSFHTLSHRSFSVPKGSHDNQVMEEALQGPAQGRNSFPNINQGVLCISDAPLSITPTVLIQKGPKVWEPSRASEIEDQKITDKSFVKDKSSAKEKRQDYTANRGSKNIEEAGEIFIVTYNKRLKFETGSRAGVNEEKIVSGYVSDSQTDNVNIRRKYSISNGIVEGLKISIVVSKGRRGNQKTIHAAAAVLGIFLLNWTPLIFCLILKLNNNSLSGQGETLAHFANLCVHINALCNPFLYVARTRGFKSVLAKIRNKLVGFEIV
ncbi:dopamine D2-like receptor [Rhopilema esculentum]|uniref:dopamine D2-like receptor n=1 Tax=Rhopilema esculentum TaxID=499914 RepID=UPI0031D0B2D3|eukprot:gene10964-19800_t